ncbi:MAG TPA: hypothetical protein VMG36_04365 [Thermoplasmata archaeon]|nr:hypothetical protein [Thermoplasmata archaeon]
MPSTPKPVDQYVPGGSVDSLTPEEEEALREQLDRVQEEKQAAISMPGLSWREWFLYRSSKMYIGFGLMIIDAWIVGAYLEDANWNGYSPRLVGFLVLSLAVAVYAEIVLCRFLWHRPPNGLTKQLLRKRSLLARLWTPVPFGRWTPEAADFRAGRIRAGPETGPDPHEFI